VWGKRCEVPCDPQLEGYLQAWLGAAGNLQSAYDLRAAAREHQAQSSATFSRARSNRDAPFSLCRI
jgi:hypothetical protein